ncbi:MAG: Rrf2 family iron-sulfur cluster assembly transcriptional regulator [Candidatus Latescibacterota bacterium]|jgi:Rrf2 family iron-sulfur cluster assembly transcriptional regulator
MHMLFSQSCKYAIRALVHLSLSTDSPSLSREIARDIQVPEHFLAKILQDLVRHQLLESFKGRGGGFQLARTPERISLGEIVHAVDGNGLTENCLLGLPNCSAESPCAMHDWWSIQRRELKKMLEGQSLTDLTKDGAPREIIK